MAERQSILDVKVEVNRTISVESLKQAICLKCANCYGAMSFANAIGGSKTDAWALCHAYELKQLLEEAEAQGLDLGDARAAVTNEPVRETLYYRRATGELSEAEFQKAFRAWQRGE